MNQNTLFQEPEPEVSEIQAPSAEPSAEAQQARIAQLEAALRKALSAADELESAAKQFDSLTNPLDLRAPMGESEMFTEDAWIQEQAYASDLNPKALFCDGWRACLIAPMPDGPEQPTDPETWQRMRRALKHGRTISRLGKDLRAVLAKVESKSIEATAEEAGADE
jgi:hypothetical protein